MRRTSAFLFSALAVTSFAQQPTHALSYGDNRMQKIDLWIADAEKPTPLLIFIHGGGFRGGSYKQVDRRAVQESLRAGVSFASIEYRLTDQGPYPMQMNDCARAVQFLRANAKEFNLDKARFGSYGGSAGACISLWLAFHDDMAEAGSRDPVSRESTRLVAAGSMNGQPTLDPRTFKEWFGIKTMQTHPAIFLLFGAKDGAEMESPRVRRLIVDASPITHLTKDDPPVYMANGGSDAPVNESTEPSVLVHHARLGIKLKEAMDKLGVECLHQYRGGPSVGPSIVSFLIDKLKKPATAPSLTKRAEAKSRSN